MTPAQLEEVWGMLDRALLAETARRGPPPVFAAVSGRTSMGSHLVTRKREGAEKMLLDERELAEHGALLDRLEAQLDRAHAASELPEEATATRALDDFMVRLRLETVGLGAGR